MGLNEIKDGERKRERELFLRNVSKDKNEDDVGRKKHTNRSLSMLKYRNVDSVDLMWTMPRAIPARMAAIRVERRMENRFKDNRDRVC